MYRRRIPLHRIENCTLGLHHKNKAVKYLKFRVQEQVSSVLFCTPQLSTWVNIGNKIKFKGQFIKFAKAYVLGSRNGQVVAMSKIIWVFRELVHRAIANYVRRLIPTNVELGNVIDGFLLSHLGASIRKFHVLAHTYYLSQLPNPHAHFQNGVPSLICIQSLEACESSKGTRFHKCNWIGLEISNSREISICLWWR